MHSGESTLFLYLKSVQTVFTKARGVGTVNGLITFRYPLFVVMIFVILLLMLTGC